MTLYASIQIPEGTQLPAHCADLQTLTRRLSSCLLHGVITNTISPELPTVCVTHFEAAPICGSCAAPLLPTGACSSRNCDFGRLSQRKPSARSLAARVPGVKLASKLKAK